MPLVKYIIDKDCALLTVDRHVKITLIDADHFLEQLGFVGQFFVILTLLAAVFMSNDSSVIVQDKSIAVSVHLDPLYCLLDTSEGKIKA